MSELSNKIKLLRGDRSAEDIAKEVGVSRESFYRIERGGSVKLSTLKQIATALRVPESDWLELLVAWLKSEAGPDARKLWLEPRQRSRPRHDALQQPKPRRTAGDNESDGTAGGSPLPTRHQSSMGEVRSKGRTIGRRGHREQSSRCSQTQH
jgi:transcriptional regulator with XRE-family HTH domain